MNIAPEWLRRLAFELPVLLDAAVKGMACKSKLEGRLPALPDPRRSRRALRRLSILVAATLVATVTVPLAAMKAQDCESIRKGAATSQPVTRPASQPANPSSSWPRISGVVRDATCEVQSDEEFITQLANVKSDEDIRKLASARPRPQACSRITVHLRGQTARHEMIAQETVTDDRGQYTFDSLAPGDYELWAELPSRPAERGAGTRMAMGKAMVRVGAYPGPNFYHLGREGFPVYVADLNLRPDVVTVRGRITNTQGIPVAGAVVTCTDQFDNQDQRSETSEGDRFIERRTVMAVTSADGTYELRGINPPDMYPTAGYLHGGSGGGEVKRSFEVRADGYRLTNRSVPLVTEELRDRSRRMLAMFKQLEQRERQARPSTKPAAIIGEKPGVPLPASSGNVIRGEDFILQPATSPTRAAGDR